MHQPCDFDTEGSKIIMATSVKGNLLGAKDKSFKEASGDDSHDITLCFVQLVINSLSASHR